MRIKKLKSEISVTVLQKRLLLLMATITFLFCLIFGRFFYVQIVWGEELTLRAVDQWNREIPVVASRGVISDRNGVVLAGSQTTFAVYVRPNALADKAYAAQVFSAIFGLDEQTLFQKLSKKNVSELTVARGASKEQIEKLVSLNLSGVYYAKDNQRWYTYGDALCQTLGFTSTDGEGIAGLEKYYNALLAGTNGEIVYATDIVGNERPQTAIVYQQAQDGAEVRLTIDIDIQLAAENAMQKAYAETGAQSVSCIVLDPQNFEVLALANYPSYDLNDIPRDDSQTLNALSRNTLVCDIYEPGSTFKVITAAADLEEYLKGNAQAFSPTRIFSSSRTRVVDGTTVKCWSTHENGKHNNQTLADALNNSCNPCFTDMALALGGDTFYSYLNAFGFGNVTGLDFAGEAVGMLLPKTALRNADLARIGFGQTVAVTGLQLACAVAAAVNGGTYYTPHLLKSVIDSGGNTLSTTQPLIQNTPISSKASAMLAQMLEGVVTEGSGKKAYIEGYHVGGKTGTAQKYENGRIAQGKYVSSFVGFFPAENPQYLALVVIDEPQGAYYGSVVAAPVAKEIFSDIIAIKNIQPLE